MLAKLDYYGMTDVGTKRDHNEDQFLIAGLNKSLRVHQTSLGLEDESRMFGFNQGIMTMVADGMGGTDEGERASQIAVESVSRYVLNTMPWLDASNGSGKDSEDAILNELQDALSRAQARILADPHLRTQKSRMGTTLTLAYILWPSLYVIHAGDSRCYLLRNSSIQQLTEDQTVAQKFLENQIISQEEAEESQWSHVLFSYLGGDPEEFSPRIYKETLEVGDSLVLCTDGLTGEVSEDQICEEVAHAETSQTCCENLIQLANQMDGSDNVTVIVCRFLSSGDAMQQQKQATEKVPHQEDVQKDSQPEVVNEPIPSTTRKQVTA